jgi:phasin family protein
MIQATEQFSAAHSTMMNTAQQLGAATITGLSKLIELNVQTTKAAMAESTLSMQALMQTKDVSQLAQCGAQIAQPAAQNFADYCKQAYDIVAQTSQVIADLFATQLDEANDQTLNMIEQAAKSAPGNSASWFVITEESLLAARVAYDQALAASHGLGRSTA